MLDDHDDAPHPPLIRNSRLSPEQLEQANLIVRLEDGTKVRAFNATRAQLNGHIRARTRRSSARPQRWGG